jgi:hypothetical protein
MQEASLKKQLNTSNRATPVINRVSDEQLVPANQLRFCLRRFGPFAFMANYSVPVDLQGFMQRLPRR